MCLKELRDEFLYDCECRHLAKGSLRNYRASTRFLLEFLERKQITELEDVRPRHLRDLMKEKQDAGNTPWYINDLLKVWRTWFNYLVEEGYLEERDNPAKKVKPLRQPRTIIDTFTAAEMKRMIQFYDGKDFLEVRNKTIIAVPVPAWPCEYVDLHPFLCIPWRKGCFCLSGCVLIGAYTAGEASVPAGKNGTAGERCRSQKQGCIVVCARFGQNRHILEQPQEMFVKQLSILRPCIVHSFCL